MQKIILPILLVITSVAALLSFSSHAFAQQAINADPPTVNYGQPVTITASGLPAKDDTYLVRIKLGSSCTLGNSLGGASITTTAANSNSPGTCSASGDSSGFWSSISCPNPSGPFKGVIDTSKLVPSGQNFDSTYKACLTDPNGLILDTSFTVKASVQTTGFTISFIFNHDGTTNSSSNPAAPGEQIGIRLANAKSGQYGIKIGDSSIQTSNCGNPTCTLDSPYPTVPTTLNTPTAQVVVADPNDNTQTITLFLKSTVSNAASPTPVPATPTPTATPFPPQPPCFSKTTVYWFTPPTPSILPPPPGVPTPTNEPPFSRFVGCGSVFTGLGFEISTYPTVLIKDLFGILLSLSGGIAILLIMKSGYQMMTAQGDHEKIKEARDVLTSAIIGLLFLIFSLIILQIIGVDILHIPGLRP